VCLWCSAAVCRGGARPRCGRGRAELRGRQFIDSCGRGQAAGVVGTPSGWAPRERVCGHSAALCGRRRRRLVHDLQSEQDGCEGAVGL